MVGADGGRADVRLRPPDAAVTHARPAAAAARDQGADAGDRVADRQGGAVRGGPGAGARHPRRETAARARRARGADPSEDRPGAAAGGPEALAGGLIPAIALSVA